MCTWRVERTALCPQFESGWWPGPLSCASVGISVGISVNPQSTLMKCFCAVYSFTHSERAEETTARTTSTPVTRSRFWHDLVSQPMKLQCCHVLSSQQKPLGIFTHSTKTGDMTRLGSLTDRTYGWNRPMHNTFQCKHKHMVVMIQNAVWKQEIGQFEGILWSNAVVLE